MTPSDQNARIVAWIDGYLMPFSRRPLMYVYTGTWEGVEPVLFTFLLVREALAPNAFPDYDLRWQTALTHVAGNDPRMGEVGFVSYCVEKGLSEKERTDLFGKAMLLAFPEVFEQWTRPDPEVLKVLADSSNS